MAPDSQAAAGGVAELDVLIIGAGLSGIDAAYRLQTECPALSFTILEARQTLGGTWDLFRYPGIRSDSDMSTLGFPFEPWDSDVAIADGPDILRYIQNTARKYGIDRRIQYGHRVVAADWSSESARWLVTVETGGETKQLRCRFLYACAGYYDYARGYMPEYPGIERYQGQVIHPQQWPEDLDVSGKRIVVIGSGATAITLVPALAAQGAQVTMLQRTPTYVINLPRRDKLAAWLRKRLPDAAAGAVTRWKNIGITLFFYHYARKKPQQTREKILHLAKRQVGEGFDVEKHFGPSYKPWDQRLCIVPNGDLFKTIRAGKAAVVTDRIETFTETGIRTQSGEELQADIVVSATGLVIQLLGGARVSVDGELVDTSKKMVYKGMMLDGVPNLAFAFGYTNASWTLKCDLSAQYVCRLLNDLQRRGRDICVTRREADAQSESMVDLESGYIQRAKSVMPQQGAAAPWRVHQNYLLDLAATRFSGLDDGAMHFEKAQAKTRSAA